jgi:hypothetical protein
MQNIVVVGGYFLACLLALLIAARWIVRNHPALREPGPAELEAGAAAADRSEPPPA